MLRRHRPCLLLWQKGEVRSEMKEGHSDNARSGHRSDENKQNEESSMQSLSLVCDDVLTAEKQDVVEAASERISLETEREDTEEELGIRGSVGRWSLEATGIRA